MDVAGLNSLLIKMREIDRNSTYVCAWDIDDSAISERDIKAIELKLGFNLCDDYKTFLKLWGHIIALDIVIVGMFRDEVKLSSPVLDTTRTFFDRFLEADLDCCTIVGITEDEEWFYLLNHMSSLVTPFDPFTTKLLVDKSLPFEEFLSNELSEIMEALD